MQWSPVGDWWRGFAGRVRARWGRFAGDERGLLIGRWGRTVATMRKDTGQVQGVMARPSRGPGAVSRAL